jgi:hypothetical protein
MQTKSDATTGNKANTTRRQRWMTYAMVGTATLAVLVALGTRRPATGAAIAYDPEPAPPHPTRPPVTRTIASRAQPPAVAARRPQVEVVFALDTTSSMSGLIEGAKRKIWSIASFIAKGQPTPDLRVGLVAYRDVGDAYVTKVFDLDADLDRVYRHLRQFRAEGGGDSPEHVGRGLHDAVHEMSWSPTKDQDVLRLIYLVGDAPAHDDYNDGYGTLKAARAALAQGIQIHAIRCGDDATTGQQWRQVASVGKGQFLTIGQDGGMRDDRTPYDEELARLHDAVSDTVVGFGAKGGEARAAIREAAEAPMAVKAARASFMAKKKVGVLGGGDLVEGLASGKVELDKVAAADLPADLRALPPAEQKAKLAKLAEDRQKTQARIADLSRKRDEYLAAAERTADRGHASGAAGFGAGAGIGGRGAGLAGPMPGRPVAATPRPTAAAAAPPPASFDAEVAKTVISGAKRIGVSY